ncbi:MAG: carbonic anhydrase [Methanotrichaceae archaeon]
MATNVSASGKKSAVTADQAVQKLIEGNARFASGRAIHPDQSAERRAEVVSSQHPFAVILSCSDSRIPPEVVFDQGIGDIFVVRTAGQVIDNVALGSIEYAVEHLNVPLIVVLGHDSCGAVNATVQGGKPEGHIGSLVEAIKPAVDEARNKIRSQDQLLNVSIDNNTKNIVKSISSSEPILSEYIKNGRLLVIGGRYHLDSGKVELIK